MIFKGNYNLKSNRDRFLNQNIFVHSFFGRPLRPKWVVHEQIILFRIFALQNEEGSLKYKDFVQKKCPGNFISFVEQGARNGKAICKIHSQIKRKVKREGEGNPSLKLSLLKYSAHHLLNTGNRISPLMFDHCRSTKINMTQDRLSRRKYIKV
jgi:hypothetical protein